MELTHSQISEILSNYTSSSEGFDTLQSLIMNSLMFHERELFVRGNAREQCNGFEFSLHIPRSRSGDFYPVLLGLIRNSAYFTYMDFPAQVQRCIYTTNWIERLNRKYKRTINMRTSMPSEKSVIFLLAAVAMEETKTTYGRRIYQFKTGKKRIKKQWKYREKKEELHTFKDTTRRDWIIY